MASKKVYDAVATVGEYTDRQGNTKKRYITVGAVFESDEGRMSLKMEAIPAGPTWSGWISFYEPKQQEQRTENKPGANVPASEYDSDIPF